MDLGRLTSNEDKGLMPMPQILPVTRAKTTLVGEIQVIQLKYDRAWKI